MTLPSSKGLYLLPAFALSPGTEAAPLEEPAQTQDILYIANDPDFRERFRISPEYTTVIVGTEAYRAYPLFAADPKIPENPSPEDFSVTSPWLITDSEGAAVGSTSKALQASFTADYTRRFREGLERELLQREQALLGAVSAASPAETVLEAARPVTGALVSTLALGVLGSAVTLEKAALAAAQRACLDLLGEVKDEMASHYGLEAPPTEEQLKKVMYSEMEASALELGKIAELVSSAKHDPPLSRTYGFARKVGQRIVAAETRIYAAAAFLSRYYGGGSAFSEFLEKQLLEGATGLETELGSDPLSDWVRDAAFAKQMFGGVYGPLSVEKGSALVLGTLENIAEARTDRALREALGEAGMEGFFETYGSLRRSALKRSSTLHDKVSYLLFLSSALLPAFPPEPSPDYWKEAARTQSRLFSLPFDGFVREYDAIAREAMLHPGSARKRAAFASAASLTLAFTHPSQAPSYAHRGPPSVRGDAALFDQAVESAEHYLSILESSGRDGPELRRYRRDIRTLRSYRTAFTTGLGQEESQNLMFLMQRYASSLEHP